MSPVCAKLRLKAATQGHSSLSLLLCILTLYRIPLQCDESVFCDIQILAIMLHRSLVTSFFKWEVLID